jgi:NAD(P)-dependent dehydrogenase (short-subunit alcohol dehydrogenase family)
MKNPWKPADMPSQAGKRIIITGATSGIGREAALQLARAGAEVIIPARTPSKADEAFKYIRTKVSNANLITGIMDVSSLESVRQFAATQLLDPRPIDTLINNAGIMGIPERRLSAEGFEMQLATNVLGHFLLTGLLLPALLQAPAPRVVTVSSYAHMNGGPLPIDDLNAEKSYKPMRAYSKTKLAGVLFARELQRRTADRLFSLSCHPGGAHTNLSNDTTFGMKVLQIMLWPFTQSAEKGAEPELFAATSPDVKPGAYYGPDGLILGLKGNVKETKMSKYAYDEAAASQLFDELEKLTGIIYKF